MASNKVFLAKGISYLKPDEPPRYRLYADVGIGTNLIGDRHRRGQDFPSSYRECGWSPEEVAADPRICMSLLTALDEMQEYFDEHFGDGVKKEKVKRVQCVADKKSHSGGIKRASKPVKRKI